MSGPVLGDEETWLAAVAEARGKPRELQAVLGQFHGRPTAAALPILRDVWQVKDSRVQGKVLDLLAQVPGLVAEEAIASYLKSGDDNVLGLAAHKLGRRHARAALPALIECAETRGSSLSETSRTAVLVVIALLADSSTHAVLVDGLTDRNPEVRKASAGALKRIGTYKSREALEQAVDELSWRRGRFARRALRDLLQAR